MLRGSSRSRNIFRKLVDNGVNGSKADIQNDCLLRLYDADSELKNISSELDSFDGKKDPIRCNLLVNQLRTAQDKVISLLFQLMDDCSCERASRDYRMKFPDEILLSEGSESLNGQIWFGAECLSAGSNILNHTKESTMLRPMAKTLTQHLDSLRNDLRDLVLDRGGAARINYALIKKMVAFDHIFATFEYEYVRTMLPIRTVAEIEKLQEVAVLFSETLIDGVKRGLIKQDDIDEFQPIVMIAIPRLAIVRGLLYKNENPIYTRHKSHMCSLFQPFHGPLHSIRKLLRSLTQHELYTLERMLANDQSMGESLCEANSVLARVKATSLQQNPKEASATNDDATSAAVDQGCNQVSDYDYNEVNQAGTSNTFTNVLMDGLQYPVGHKRSSTDSGVHGNTEVMAERKVGESSPRLNNGRSDEQKMDHYSELQASSSKVIANEELHISRNDSMQNSPAGNSTLSPSSPVSSQINQQASSSITIRTSSYEQSGSNESKVEISNHHECDTSAGECCLSPPESDAQLEKLIANFSPSMDDDDENGATSQEIKLLSSDAATVKNITNSTNTTCVNAQNNANVAVNYDTNTANNAARSVEVSPPIEQTDTKVREKGDEEFRLDELYQKKTQQLLHRLFVAISGVADQLQSNFASDLRFILRHIFSSEIDGHEDEDEEGSGDNVNGLYDDDDDDNGREYSNQDNSDSSLPIEQGIEAREANLIDFDSGYTVMDTDYPPGTRAGLTPLSNQNSTTYEFNERHPTGSSVATVTITASATHLPIRSSDPLISDQRPFQTSLEHQQNHSQRLNEELIAGIIRGSSDPIHSVIYDSPNDPSIMEESQHQQRLMQQHLQSASARASARAAAAAAAAAQQAYDQVLVGSGQMEHVREPSQRNSERRSRHHHHHHHGHSGSSRSSRRPRGPPVWVPDQLVVQCSCCQAPFTLFRRRHHCRACGQIFCADCSKFTKNLNCWGYNGPVRVCESCFNQN